EVRRCRRSVDIPARSGAAAARPGAPAAWANDDAMARNIIAAQVVARALIRCVMPYSPFRIAVLHGPRSRARLQRFTRTLREPYSCAHDASVIHAPLRGRTRCTCPGDDPGAAGHCPAGRSRHGARRAVDTGRTAAPTPRGHA